MTLVNLFDSLFRQTVCSSGWQVPQRIAYVRDLRQFAGITIFTDAWINHPVVDEVECLHKVGWLREPYCLHPGIYEATLDNLPKFDYILTYYEPFLKLDPRYRFVPYGGIWIDKPDWGIKPKTKNVSMIIGDKMSTEGHRLRRQIADALDGHPLVDFYGIKGKPLTYSPQAKLMALADYRFSIVTETCLEYNLFTEWLLDCLIVGTIPIYWGCKNDGKFFDREGIFTFRDIAELNKLLEMIQDYGPEMVYQSTYPAIERNYLSAQPFAITEDWIFENVLQC